MRRRRVARRVALSKRHRNTCVNAAKGETLATKDMHCIVQFFPTPGSAGGLRDSLAEQVLAVGEKGRGAVVAGVWRSPTRRVARRVAWATAPVLPLLPLSALATKQKMGAT